MLSKTENSSGIDPCQARNDLFNTIFTVSNAAFCVCTFLFGILGDRFGLLVKHYDESYTMSHTLDRDDPDVIFYRHGKIK